MQLDNKVSELARFTEEKKKLVGESQRLEQQNNDLHLKFHAKETQLEKLQVICLL